MSIKMLHEKKNGEIEVFYVDSFEEKQLYDTRRKKYRRLNQELPDDAKLKKRALHNRQMLARELRVVIGEIRQLES